jgi:hypothetical protein
MKQRGRAENGPYPYWESWHPTVVNIGQENGTPIDICCEDHGSGHGDAGRILSYENAVNRLPSLIQDLTYVTVEGGPRNVAWTHSKVVNPRAAGLVKG